MFGRVVFAGAMLAGLATGAQASVITWDFDNLSNTTVSPSGTGFGNSLTFTAGGEQIRVSAWSLTSGGAFEAAKISRYSGAGLGICNQGEGKNCSSPSHQIDNVGDSGRNDFVLVELLGGGSFDPTSMSIRRFSSSNSYKDLDVTYWVGDSDLPIDLAGVTLAALTGLGFGAQTNDDNSNSAAHRQVSIDGNTAANALLFGARIGYDEDDGFKLEYLTASYTAPPPPSNKVPEPSTLGILGLGLVVLSLALARRRVA